VITAEDLAASPNPLARHYRRFRVEERVLLTGHSHQAWPDVAAEGQLAALEDAAALVDDKWDRALAVADEVRAGFRRLLADPGAEIALGASTHELVVRLLSALDLGGTRPRLVSTDGEFHSLRRQLARLAEGGVEVVLVPAEPAGTLATVLAANPAEPHVFYAANNRGLFRSPDAGRSWERIALEWPDDPLQYRPAALEVVEV